MFFNKKHFLARLRPQVKRNSARREDLVSVPLWLSASGGPVKGWQKPDTLAWEGCPPCDDVVGGGGWGGPGLDDG